MEQAEQDKIIAESYRKGFSAKLSKRRRVIMPAVIVSCSIASSRVYSPRKHRRGLYCTAFPGTL